MLSLRNRLKKKKDFEKVFKEGKSVQDNGLFLKIRPTGNPYSRFGFIVSNKIVKKAVVRNKMRRQLHEVVRKLISEMKTNVDAVFIVRPGFEGHGFTSIEMMVRRIFKRINII